MFVRVKNIALMTIMLIIIAYPVCAMEFSAPIYLGSISTDPSGAFYFKGDVRNNGQPYNVPSRRDTVSYEKGVAVFGYGNNNLYCYYDYSVLRHKWKHNTVPLGSHILSFGDEDRNAAVGLDNFEYGYDVYVTNLSNKSIYILKSNPYISSGTNIIVLGKQQNGKFVKYIDCDDINERYFGLKRNEYGTTMGKGTPYYHKFYISDDAIVIEYKITNYNIVAGKFILRWDENAQWFSIKQVVY